MYEVEIAVDETSTGGIPDEWLSLLVAAARATLVQQESRAGELTILITDDARMAVLNQAHRKMAGSTDVLSFPTGDSPSIPELAHYFGDIAISLPRARAHAAAGGHSPQEELQVLVVHGTLHLLGHDHAETSLKRRMWAAQEEILETLGVSMVVNSQGL